MSRCSNCRRECPTERCSRCKTARYCGEACQRQHWKAHREACAAFAAPSRGRGTEHHAANARIAKAVALAITPEAERELAAELEGRDDHAIVIVYRGPAECGPGPLSRSNKAIVPVADVVEFLRYNSLPGASWEPGDRKLAIVVGSEGRSFTCANCVALESR